MGSLFLLFAEVKAEVVALWTYENLTKLIEHAVVAVAVDHGFDTLHLLFNFFFNLSSVLIGEVLTFLPTSILPDSCLSNLSSKTFLNLS